MIVAMAVGSYVAEYSDYFTYSMSTSLNIGLFSLAAVVGGLMGSTWIAGWLYSVALVSIGTIVCAAVATPWWTSSIWNDYLAIGALWPLLLLGCTAPLGLMRRFRGWSLTTHEDTLRSRHPMRIEDLFLLSVIVASSFSLTRLLREFNQVMPEEQELILLAACSAFSCLFTIPAVAITFRTRWWMSRLAGWVGLALASLAACFVLNWLMDMSPGNRFDLILTLAGIGVAWLVMFIGAAALLASGVKLTHFAPVPGAARAPGAAPAAAIGSSDPLEGESTDTDTDTGAGARRQARLLTGVVGMVDLLSALGLNFTTYRQAEFFRTIQRYKTDFAGFASDCMIRGETVVALSLAPEVTDQDLVRFEGSTSTIEGLTLSGTQITDAGLEKISHLPKLWQLDLSNTAITNVGLEKLSNMAVLSVANTQVDFEQALTTAKQLQIRSLDVSGIGITDQQFSDRLDIAPGMSLKLSRNPLTDAGIAHLLQQSFKLSRLDLSDLPIDGCGLLFANCPMDLNLDGTMITDASLTQLLNSGQYKKLSIRRTAITAAVLPLLATQVKHLVLGEGLITEQDLANLPSVQWSHLSLNDKKFTGASLAGGKIQVQSLDLSRSGVTDSTLEQLSQLGYVYHLDLSHTEISDAGLKWIQCAEIDVRDTRVTAHGLLENLQNTRILISHDQFTPKELVALRKIGAVIDEEPTFRH